MVDLFLRRLISLLQCSKRKSKLVLFSRKASRLIQSQSLAVVVMKVLSNVGTLDTYPERQDVVTVR